VNINSYERGDIDVIVLRKVKKVSISIDERFLTVIPVVE